MPARKNRPGKHGDILPADQPLDPEETALLRTLEAAERKEPHQDHYVGWPDMHIAKSLAKKGYIVEGRLATGCFFLTPKARGRMS